MDWTGDPDKPTPSGRRRQATSAGAQHLDLATLSAYVDRTLSAADQRAVEAHLAACPSCRQELAEIARTVDLLRGLPRYQPRRRFGIDASVARRERGSIVWLGPYLSALPALRVATAAVTLLFLGTVAAHVLTSSNATSDREFAADQVVTTQNSEEDAAVPVDTATPARTRAADAEVMEQTADEPQEAAQESDTTDGAAAGDESRPESADSETSLREAPAPAQSAPITTTVPTPAPVPTETAVPTRTPTPVSERTSSTFGEGFPWLVVEILLGVLLILLATAFFMLRRLRRRLGSTR